MTIKFCAVKYKDFNYWMFTLVVMFVNQETSNTICIHLQHLSNHDVISGPRVNNNSAHGLHMHKFMS